MNASDLYTCQRTGAGPNDYRLTLRGPIPTRDARTFGPGLPLFGPGASVRLPTARARGMTRDETLTPMTSERTISRGTYWDGDGVNEKLDEKVGPIRDFVHGFTLGNVVHAEDPGTLINLGRVYLPQVEDEELREGMTRALDEAEEEWRKDKRSQDQTTFRPGTQASEVDKYWQRSDGERSTRMYPRSTDAPVAPDAPHIHAPASGGRSVMDAARGSRLFATAAKHTRDWAKGLPAKRAALTTQDRTAPAPKARVTSGEFAALRRGKGAA